MHQAQVSKVHNGGLLSSPLEFSHPPHTHVVYSEWSAFANIYLRAFVYISNVCFNNGGIFFLNLLNNLIKDTHCYSEAFKREK
jgi:hypothetical protein